MTTPQCNECRGHGGFHFTGCSYKRPPDEPSVEHRCPAGFVEQEFGALLREATHAAWSDGVSDPNNPLESETAKAAREAVTAKYQQIVSEAAVLRDRVRESEEAERQLESALASLREDALTPWEAKVLRRRVPSEIEVRRADAHNYAILRAKLRRIASRLTAGSPEQEKPRGTVVRLSKRQGQGVSSADSIGREPTGGLSGGLFPKALSRNAFTKGPTET